MVAARGTQNSGASFLPSPQASRLGTGLVEIEYHHQQFFLRRVSFGGNSAPLPDSCPTLAEGG